MKRKSGDAGIFIIYFEPRQKADFGEKVCHYSSAELSITGGLRHAGLDHVPTIPEKEGGFIKVSSANYRFASSGTIIHAMI